MGQFGLTTCSIGLIWSKLSSSHKPIRLKQVKIPIIHT